MNRPLSILVMIVVAASLSAAPSDAECRNVTKVRFVYGHAVTYTVRVCDASGPAAPVDQPGHQPVIDSDIGIGACLTAAIMLGGDSDYCREEADEPVQLTVALIAAAFRNTQLPAAVLRVQPPGGRTLVNFETNFFTQRDAFTRHVNLLGQQVTLRIRPAGFTWQFGDGTTATTTTPGAPHPDLDVTHSYSTADPMSPRVDTTYRAEWRLDAKPWRPVPGSVTIAGEPVTLEVIEARPTLVAHE